MTELAEIAPLFVELAHKIVGCSAATVDGQQRPRSRVLHPYCLSALRGEEFFKRGSAGTVRWAESTVPSP